MCGIFGIVTDNPDLDFLKRATDALAHRGPDDAGYYLDGSAGLGHRRLSIIDVAGGHQPVFNEDGTKCIVFNGEIYNYGELRDRLIGLGHRFATSGDTETILHAYEEWGEACVDQLRGMFAFAIWDAAARVLFLSRDRFGIKPLFYSRYGGGFCFASEMKAILADKRFPREMDEETLAAYFALSYIPGEMTIFKDIRKLLPGHNLTWRNGAWTIRRYWDLDFRPDRGKSEKFFLDGAMELLRESVSMHLMSEVPLGAFLSGGVDSSTVVALMSEFSESPVNTVTMGFGGAVGGYLDERSFARQMAERYGTNHREFEVLPSAAGLIHTIVTAFDEPFADDSAIPSYYVCQLARENVTVALSGLGGDEVFTGYERHLGFLLSGLFRRVPAFFRDAVIRPLVQGLPERADGHYTINHLKRFVRSFALPPDECYFGFLCRLRPGIRDTFFADREHFAKGQRSVQDLFRHYFNAPHLAEAPYSLNRALYCDIKTYLPEDILAVTDRMSMQHSLEVRVPFLDHKFVEFCATIPPGMKMKWLRKKYVLKKAVRDLVPREIIAHRKQGFVGPMAHWLKNDLKSYTYDMLSENALRRHQLLHPPTVAKILEEHFSGREIHDSLIWSMIIFQAWHDHYMTEERAYA